MGLKSKEQKQLLLNNCEVAQHLFKKLKGTKEKDLDGGQLSPLLSQSEVTQISGKLETRQKQGQMRVENISAKIKGASEELLRFQQSCQSGQRQISSKLIDISRIEQVYADLYLGKVRAKVEKLARIMELISGEISFASVKDAEELQSEISIAKDLSNQCEK